MPVSLSKMMDEFSPEDRTEIEGHARQLIAERRSLMQIRKALKLTQSDIAEVLKTSQAHVAQIERKRDAMVSTIERIVNAMGGELDLVVRIPHRGQVVLKLGEHAGEPALEAKPKRRKAKTVVAKPSPSSHGQRRERRPKARASG